MKTWKQIIDEFQPETCVNLNWGGRRKMEFTLGKLKFKKHTYSIKFRLIATRKDMDDLLALRVYASEATGEITFDYCDRKRFYKYPELGCSGSSFGGRRKESVHQDFQLTPTATLEIEVEFNGERGPLWNIGDNKTGHKKWRTVELTPMRGVKRAASVRIYDETHDIENHKGPRKQIKEWETAE